MESIAQINTGWAGRWRRQKPIVGKSVAQTNTGLASLYDAYKDFDMGTRQVHGVRKQWMGRIMAQTNTCRTGLWCTRTQTLDGGQSC